MRENLLQGPKALFSDTDSDVGVLRSRLESSSASTGWSRSTSDPQNTHPDYIAGNRNTFSRPEHHSRSTFDDSLTWSQAGAARGAHVQGRPLQSGARTGRQYAFGHRGEFHRAVHVPDQIRPFNASDATKLIRSASAPSMGQFDFNRHRPSPPGSHISDKRDRRTTS